MKRKDVTEIIIGVLAIVSIILLAVESLVEMSKGLLMWIYIVDLIICIIFAGDFIQRLVASDSKSHFMKTNGYEILAMIPAISLHFLGNLFIAAEALRAVRLLRVVRVIMVMARMGRMISDMGKLVKNSNLLTLFIITIGIIFIGAYAALVLDHGVENAQITNFSDAIWWSVSTVSTVGYGDIVPQSVAGRVVGMILMVVGIGVMAALISEVSAALVEMRMKRYMEEGDFRTSVISEIKNRLDKIDELSESELALLIQMIQTLKKEGKCKG